MLKMFYAIGIIAVTLVVYLTGAGIYLIYRQEKDGNRNRTEKARQTRLDNLKRSNGQFAVTEDDVIQANVIIQEQEQTLRDLDNISE